MRTVEENKALLEKYPILRQKHFYTGEPIDNNDEYTYLDAMPQGWAKAFGIPMFEDIQNEVNTWTKEEQEGTPSSLLGTDDLTTLAAKHMSIA